MIETTIALICLFATVVIILVKIYDLIELVSKKPKRDYKLIVFSLILLLLCYGFYMVAFLSSVQYSSVVTAGTETFVLTNSAYVTLSLFAVAMNFFLILGIMLTVLEVIAMYSSFSRSGRRR
jgi:amino acid transporter